jgi:uncharacterized membrane protein
VFQSVFIALWIVLNSLKQFDGKQLQLLTLLLSLQAAYAAPLILLAQNRQEQRDRLQTELDRRVAERTQVDTEFLARELAGVRLGLSDVASSSELEDHLERISRAIERLADRLAAIEGLAASADAYNAPIRAQSGPRAGTEPTERVRAPTPPESSVTK